MVSAPSHKPRRTAASDARSRAYDATSRPLVVGRVASLPVEAALAAYEAADPFEAVKRAFAGSALARQALASASPSLARAVCDWIAGRTPRNPKTPLRALAYLVRMASRPTPFGLCAGIGDVPVGQRTTLSVDVARARTFTRPDMGLMLELVRATEAAVGPTVAYVTNPCTFERGGRLHVVNADLSAPTLDAHGDRVTEQRAISLKNTDAVRFVRALCTAATPYVSIVQTLADEFGAPADEARRVVDRLIHAGVVISELRPSPLGDPVNDLARRFVALDAPIAGALTAALKTASDFDAVSIEARDERDVARVRDAFAALVHDPPANAIQVDLRVAFSGALGARIVEDAASLAELYVRCGPRTALSTLRGRFEERYEGSERMVRVLELVDPNVGLGVPDGPDPVVGDSRERDALVMRLASDALRSLAPEVELDARDMEILFPLADVAGQFPRALEIGFQVAAPSLDAVEAGDYAIVPAGFIGSAGAAKSLGRFASMLGGDVVERACAIARSTCNPDELTAELAYAPVDGRSYNVDIRPLLYDHEVRVGIGGDPPPSAIPASDLWVGLDEAGFFLWSETLRRRVSVRETHLFATTTSAPNLCRFLSLLETQGTRTIVGFPWGPAAGLTYRPRVRTGRIVLSPRTWRFARPDLGADVATARNRLRELRGRWDVPRYVLLVEYDNRLLIDLESNAAAALVLDQCKGDGVLLYEALPGPGQLWVRGNLGCHVVEFVASVVRSHGATVDRAQRADAEPVLVAGRTRHGPGSRWTYARLFMGPQAIDDHLRSAIAPLVRALRDRGRIDRWFFVRYGSPSHLRLRLRATPDGERTVREAVLEAAEDWLASDRIERYSLDTYDPEYERYGGVDSIDDAERFFEWDSDACLGVIETGATSTDDLVAAAAASFDVFVRSRGLDDVAASALKAPANRGLGGADRDALRRIAAGASHPQHPPPPLVSQARAQEWRLPDLLHLHCNRLGLRPDAELRVCALVRALAQSRRARLTS